MENGDGVVNGEHRGEEEDLQDGILQLESAAEEEPEKGLVNNSEINDELMRSLVKGPENSEVFVEEPMDHETFFTPAFHHRATDSRDSQDSVYYAVAEGDGFIVENGDISSNLNPEDKDIELVNGSEGPGIDDSLYAVEQEGIVSLKLENPIGEQDAVEEKTEVLEESGGEAVVEAKLYGAVVNDMKLAGESSSVTLVGDEESSENGEKKLTEEKSENGEYDELIRNGTYEADSDGAAENGVAECEDQFPIDEGVKESLDVSVHSYLKIEGDHPEEALFATDNGLITKTYASEVKDSTPEIELKEAEGERSSSCSKPEIGEEFDRESVLVEDLGESSSTENDDDDITSSQSAATTTSSVPETKGGPSLPSRPAGLGSSAPLLEPTHRPLQQHRANGGTPHRQSQLSEEPMNDDTEENDETREKLQMIRVKFLRLAYRLGQTPHNVVVAQVLYRLGLAEQLRRNTNRAGVFSFDRASVMAEQLEAAGQEPLDFSCTIMVIGKTGVGKSATINSIFDDVKFPTDAFQATTTKVQDIVGTVQGIKIRVIDTPGLSPSYSDQRSNEKILRSVKKFISKSPPDIVLYFDRLDMQSRDYGDVPFLRSITDIFGASIWFNAIIVLTHAAKTLPEGPNGNPMSYEMFVSQRSHVVQQSIRQAAGDLRLMNPVSLVENHSACRTNRAGQRVLPNGQVWKPQLLLLSFASKILAEANTLLKLQDTPAGRPARARSPPLPFLLSSLLQSRTQLKLPEEQLGDEAGDDDLEEESDSEDGYEYDELPPFRSLNKSQLTKLSKAQRKAYFEELDYREKLYFKKQLKEERRRRKLMKKMAEEVKEMMNDYNSDNADDENSGPANVPVPMPDLVLPTSFDSDNPSHRYRFLDTSNQWVVRPVLETQGWDHDVGYDGLNVERLFAVKDKVPVSVSGQLTKDKKECTFQMELAGSIKHSDAGSTSLGLDVQTVGKDMAYTLRGETRLKNFKRNDSAAGASVTILGDTMSAGVKIEDKLVVNKRFKLLMSGGAMAGRGDVAYGGRLEATLRDKDYPIGRSLSNLALSVVDWHGDLAIGCNLQSQIPLGRGTNVVGHANVNNKGSGQVGIRLNSSEQLQIALIALVPVFRHVKRVLFGSSQEYE